MLRFSYSIEDLEEDRTKKKTEEGERRDRVDVKVWVNLLAALIPITDRFIDVTKDK
jgi:hypothetical protein